MAESSLDICLILRTRYVKTSISFFFLFFFFFFGLVGLR